MIGTLFPLCSDIFDAMFTSKANAGDVIIQQGNGWTRLIDILIGHNNNRCYVCVCVCVMFVCMIIHVQVCSHLWAWSEWGFP